MDAQEIGTHIRRFLKGQMPGMEHEIDRIPEDVPLWEVIGSLSLLELVDYLEQAFGIEVPPLDFIPEHFESIERIATYVARRQGASA